MAIEGRAVKIGYFGAGDAKKLVGEVLEMEALDAPGVIREEKNEKPGNHQGTAWIFEG